MISFDKLKPGTYKLEETKPAPGYEGSNVTWTVRITDEGKVYIKQDNASTNGARSAGEENQEFEPNAILSVVDPNSLLKKNQW